VPRDLELCRHRRSSDPAERTDLAADNHETVTALEAVLASRQKASLDLRRSLGGSSAVESDSADALRALGYLDREPTGGE